MVYFLIPSSKCGCFFIKEIEATNPHYLFTKQSKTYEGSLVLTVTRPPYSVLKKGKSAKKLILQNVPKVFLPKEKIVCEIEQK